MLTLDETRALCQRALAGEELADPELEALMATEPGSTQDEVLQAAALELSRRANGGKGYIYGQIGMDATPCPGNCMFCSFAACNTTETGRIEASVEEVVHYARLFAQGGVHLISLMTTITYSFEKYLDVVRQVRAAIGPRVSIMVNIGDISYEQACQLKEAGGTCIYHAIRLREGQITDLDPQVRWQTVDNARAAGLDISTAVEPVYIPQPESEFFNQTPAEIIASAHEVIAAKPFCSGIGRLHNVPGTKMADVIPWDDGHLKVIAAVFRLMARESIPKGGQGSVKWVDAGLDPRGREFSTADDEVRADIERVRQRLQDEGWDVPDWRAKSALAE